MRQLLLVLAVLVMLVLLVQVMLLKIVLVLLLLLISNTSVTKTKITIFITVGLEIKCGYLFRHLYFQLVHSVTIPVTFCKLCVQVLTIITNMFRMNVRIIIFNIYIKELQEQLTLRILLKNLLFFIDNLRAADPAAKI